MRFDFFTPKLGMCTAKLRAKGAYGFSRPMQVEVSAPNGKALTCLYRNAREMPGVELKHTLLVRIAIARFLAASGRGPGVVDVDSTMPMYDGKLSSAHDPVSVRVSK